MADRYEKLFWIIPLSALVLASIIGAGAIEYKINTILPNAEIELLELKKMSCPEIKARNAFGSFDIPSNGEFAREKIDSCKEADLLYKAKLKNILRSGTHEDKIKAGFVKLWFGEYDHIDYPVIKKTGQIVYPEGSVIEGSEFLGDDTINVIIGYNNTVTVTNKDDTAHVFAMDDPQYYEYSSPGVILPNATHTITFDHSGIYKFHSHPWLTGTVKVFDFDGKVTFYASDGAQCASRGLNGGAVCLDRTIYDVP